MNKSTFLAVLLTVIAAALVVAALIWPVQLEKDQISDSRKSSQIRSLEVEIEDHHSTEGELPDSLSELDISSDDLRASLGDYEYNKIRSSSYQICANFATDTSEDDDGFNSSFSTFVDTYDHTAGRNCFDFESFSFNSRNSFDFEEFNFDDDFGTDNSFDFDDFNFDDDFGQDDSFNFDIEPLTQ